MTKSRVFGLTLLALLWFITGCQKGSVTEEVRAAQADEQTVATLSVAHLKARSAIPVPAGTKLHVRLDHLVSTEKNVTGDLFRAHLDKPILIGGKLLAPTGSQIIGELVSVDDADRIKGRAELTMRLRRLVVNREDYALETHPRTLRAQGTKKKDATVIGGSAATGALIGAVAGGKKGAAVGAGVGAGAGTGYVLATKGKEVKLPAETRLIFTLASPVKLPVYKAAIENF